MGFRLPMQILVELHPNLTRGTGVPVGESAAMTRPSGFAHIAPYRTWVEPVAQVARFGPRYPLPGYRSRG